jgi:hypothetical protein
MMLTLTLRVPRKRGEAEMPRLIVVLVVTAMLLAFTPAWAQDQTSNPESPNYKLHSWVVGAGGAPTSSPGFMANSTAGQSSPIGICSAADKIVSAGFWAQYLEAPVLVTFIRGDDDGDGELTISDPILSLCAQFADCGLGCHDASDADDDGEITISDPIYNLAAQFSGGDAPPAPFPACGEDPTEDALDCVCHSVCMGCPGLMAWSDAGHMLMARSAGAAAVGGRGARAGQSEEGAHELLTGGEAGEELLDLPLRVVPTPSSGTTLLRFSVLRDGRARLVIYNPAGQVVRTLVDGHVGAGVKEVEWDGLSASGVRVPSGIYFVRMETSRGEEVGKVILLK